MLAAIEGPDILIVLAVVLLLFGSTQIPKLARSLGSASREFKRGQDHEPPPETPVVVETPTVVHAVTTVPAGTPAVTTVPVVTAPPAPPTVVVAAPVGNGSAPTSPTP
ncbi:MAG TPA: twin-arginine translocase TatA/TatE family subunit [Acidimicrobiales bacterium]